MAHLGAPAAEAGAGPAWRPGVDTFVATGLRSGGAHQDGNNPRPASAPSLLSPTALFSRSNDGDFEVKLEATEQQQLPPAPTMPREFEEPWTAWVAPFGGAIPPFRHGMPNRMSRMYLLYCSCSIGALPRRFPFNVCVFAPVNLQGTEARAAAATRDRGPGFATVPLSTRPRRCSVSSAGVRSPRRSPNDQVPRRPSMRGGASVAAKSHRYHSAPLPARRQDR